ncbi:hypothetical protein BDV93DRAFT_510844 [Ceratobasidium sp. AG-I]|nr:hypothetical protein BDV93DRAFT_510844 [Ceratobasidium sp. AG-I]
MINGQRQFWGATGEQSGTQYLQPSAFSTSDYDIAMEAPATLMSQSSDSASPQPPPGPLRRSVTLPPVANEFFHAELGSHATLLNFNGPNYLPPQNMIIQTPALSPTQSMFPPPTQFASNGMTFQPSFAPNRTYGGPEGDFDFGPMLDFSKLTDEFFPEDVNEILSMSSLNEWPKDDEPQTTALASSAPPMLPQTQSPSNGTMSFKSPFAPNGTVGSPEDEFDFGPMLDFSPLTDEFFPEGVNEILRMSNLNEWPNEYQSLPASQDAPMHTELTAAISPDNIENIMSRMSLNGQPNESPTPRY